MDVHAEVSERHKKVDPLNELRQRKYEAGHGDAEAFHRQHAKGKLTARERIAQLLDADSFQEMAPYTTHRHGDFGLDQQRHAGDGVASITTPSPASISP